MNLPRRQQEVLDQIERALRAADPGLKSMFATFGRRAKGQPLPAAEATGARSRGGR